MGEVSLGDLVEVQEGRAKILVPADHAVKGPGRAGGAPFYNRSMAFNRHVSVLVVGALPPARRVLDGLASTGVLGIRVALEARGEREVTLNDRRPEAFALMQRNAERNGAKVRVERENLNALLARERFDYVDVDPFGTPVAFVDGALRAVAPRGFLGVTATDTATLAGTYPQTCWRRYGATPVRAPFRHEVGVRILVGALVRWGARHDLAVRPLLAFWHGHGYKAILRVRRGARRAEEALRQMAHVRVEEGERVVGPVGPFGPLWGGPLMDGDLMASLQPSEGMPASVGRALERWREEAGAPPLFYTTDEVARAFRMPAPPMQRVLTSLRDAGYQASRTSFDPKGFKTDARWEEIRGVLQTG